MLNKYKKALEESSDQFIDYNPLNFIFWEDYEKKMSLISSDEAKNNKNVKLLKQTVFSLFKTQNIDLHTHNTCCTEWINKQTLCFTPSLITTQTIETEQQDSFKVMHESGHPIDIDIIINLQKLTFLHITKLTFKASLNNIKNGISLWTTLPHKVKKVVIKRPENGRIFFEKVLPTVLEMVSHKIRERIVVTN